MGYYNEKEKYEESLGKNKNSNKCPKCKKGLMVVTIVPWFLYKHIFKSFCPVCGYTIKKMV